MPPHNMPHALEMETDEISHGSRSIDMEDDKSQDAQPLLWSGTSDSGSSLSPLKHGSPRHNTNSTSCCPCWVRLVATNPEFFEHAVKFAVCFFGLQASYLTWGYMQELIMTSTFVPTEGAPDGKFPSAAFCVFSNRLLAVIVAMIACKIKHGAVFANNKAPLYAFCPPAFSNTMSSWSQYASLKYVSFPEQTVFKSSKIIAVMLMGKLLQGKSYPCSQYVEAFFITVGVAIFSLASKSGDRDTNTELVGLLFLCMYIGFDSFTSQYQDRIYTKYGRPNVDPYQMMLGVNVTAITMTTLGLLLSGDFPVVWEFLLVNPSAGMYNILTAITSASGQICIFFTIKHFGPIIFTIIMTTRQMFSICLSAFIFGHVISLKAIAGACVVFGVLFYQIRRKYKASLEKSRKNTTIDTVIDKVPNKSLDSPLGAGIAKPDTTSV